MAQLILVKDGESVWSNQNKIAGWSDIELSENGFSKLLIAGQKLYRTGIDIDTAFTSYLKRGFDSLEFILKQLQKKNLNIHHSWKLNDRHFGALEGLNKNELAIEFGNEQLQLWCHSYEVLPPLFNINDTKNPIFNYIYQGIDSLPRGESFETCMQRVIPFWYSDIYKELKLGNNVLIVAHEYSIKSLVMFLDQKTKKEALNIELLTDHPIIYTFDSKICVTDKQIL